MCQEKNAWTILDTGEAIQVFATYDEERNIVIIDDGDLGYEEDARVVKFYSIGERVVEKMLRKNTPKAFTRMIMGMTSVHEALATALDSEYCKNGAVKAYTEEVLQATLYRIHATELEFLFPEVFKS
jgi:hypothetical protein